MYYCHSWVFIIPRFQDLHARLCKTWHNLVFFTHGFLDVSFRFLHSLAILFTFTILIMTKRCSFMPTYLSSVILCTGTCVNLLCCVFLVCCFRQVQIVIATDTLISFPSHVCTYLRMHTHMHTDGVGSYGINILFVYSNCIFSTGD